MDKRNDPAWKEADEMSIDISLNVSKRHPEWDEDDLIEYRRELREDLYWEIAEERYRY